MTTSYASVVQLREILTHFETVCPKLQDRNGNTFLHLYFGGYKGREYSDFDIQLLRVISQVAEAMF